MNNTLAKLITNYENDQNRFLSEWVIKMRDDFYKTMIENGKLATKHSNDISHLNTDEELKSEALDRIEKLWKKSHDQIKNSLSFYMDGLEERGNKLEFLSCFISYSGKDEDFAKRLCADLRDNSVNCWYAPEDLKIGDKFRTVIDQSIRVHDKLLLILSEHSIESEWVEKEVETAFEKERNQKSIVLLPIRLDDTVMKTNQSWAADVRRTRHIGDFCNWTNEGTYWSEFQRLLSDLSAENNPTKDNLPK